MAQPVEKPAMLQRRFVFGVDKNVKDGCHFIDENTCCWAAGKTMVVYNTQYATQKFIQCSESCEHITACALSANRRFLAVAEKSEVPGIAVYDPQTRRRKRFLQVPEIGSMEYVSLAFSSDGRHLAAQGGYPDWNLVLYNVDKGKALGMVGASDRTNPRQDRGLINQCSICPKDPTLLCVSGNEIFRFFRLTDGVLRPSPGGFGKADPMDYRAHLWLPPEDRIVVSTRNGDLLLVENGEYKHQLPLSPSDGVSIDTLVAYSKGFLCGGDMGLVTIFERSEDKELFRKMRTLKVETARKDADGLAAAEGNVGVIGFSLTPPPAEEYVAVATDNKQLCLLNLSNADFTKADDRITDVVAQPFHAQAITGLDICLRKPLIVTCADEEVFLWNYTTNTVEVAKRFSTKALSVAIHPSGLHLLIGFPDKLRFMNVYGDDIREFRNFTIRSCNECRFSNGGQFFAAMHSTIIHVYYTYTCELLGHLRGHNGKVKSIYFVPPDDQRILSAGADGAVYEFSLAEFHKVTDHTLKSLSYEAVTGDDTTVWAACGDYKIRQLERSHLTVQAEHELSGNSVRALCLSQSIGLKLLFAGCTDGSLRVFNTYLAEKAVAERNERRDDSRPKTDILIESHAGHAGDILRVGMTFDESLVVTVGRDGVMTMWDVVAPHRTARREIPFAEEILIDKKDLEDRNRTISDLQAKVTELKQRMEHQQYKRELKHEEKIQELKERFQEGRTKQSGLLEKLLSEKNEQAIKFTDHLGDTEDRHKSDLRKIDQEYTAKIKALEDQSAKLKQAIDDQRADFEQQKTLREDEGHTEATDQQQEHTRQIEEAASEIASLKTKKETAEEDADEVCNAIEHETDAEIIELKERYEERMKAEQKQCAQLKGENIVLQSKETLAKADLDAKRADIADKQQHQQSLHMQIHNFERDLEALRHELNERSETIGDKDKRIYDLKKKNEELGKFRFVLEYKISELNEQIAPREEEIRAANAKYAAMEVESERYLRTNESLMLNIRGLKLKLDGQKKEIDSLRGRLQDGQQFQTQLCTELTVLHDEQNPRKLKELTKALYLRHTAATQASKQLAAKATDDAQRDYNRAREYRERTVAGLKKKLVKDADTNRADRSRIIGENVTLIKEINELRREARTLQQQKRGFAADTQRDETQRELDMQKTEIQRLRTRLEDLERQLHAAGKPVSMSGPPPL